MLWNCIRPREAAISTRENGHNLNIRVTNNTSRRNMHTSSELFTSEIYSIHKAIANSAWRNPPTPDWLRSGHIKSLKFIDKEKTFLLALVPVLLLLPILLTALAPLRGSCGVERERTCGVVRATWCHGPGLILGQGDMKQQQQKYA
ncbi:hypothetical protein AVEN_235603-1 [Araneus ventricosus]|uniref:Uncharacterized protein n=1 Tax=Araneus ventricosus TaxID=182803 RepID=A0A4Y2BRB7_ARAVE|nr:hypothetical protein AVEN_235603-1 [Araneus ventricosus]